MTTKKGYEMSKESQKQFRYFIMDFLRWEKRKFTRKEIKMMREAWIASEINQEADKVLAKAKSFVEHTLSKSEVD